MHGAHTRRIHAVTAVLFAFALVACADDTLTPDGDRPDLSDQVYDPNRLLNIDIELPEASWDSLRHESRDLGDVLGGDCLSEPFGSPFTWFEGAVTIDGVALAPVDVRKKGFLGSLDDVRPSLKLDLGEYESDRRFETVRRLTLNNNLSDPAQLRQCIGYALFGRAGVPSPRCNFAEVTVNGRDLGVYSNVEGVRKPFLRRHFSSDEGNLYEGTLSDFRPGWTATFEPDTNSDEPDNSDILGVVDALSVDDDSLMDSLAEVLDLDAWFTFWAVESLILHWDGYSGNTNNYYVYFDPDTGLAHFIPWGIDNILSRGDRGGAPDSAFVSGALANRLYQHPEGRRMYETRLRELLDTVWDEDWIQSEIDRISILIGSSLTDAQAAVFEQEVAVVASVVAERRSVILAELDAPPVDAEFSLRPPICFVSNGSIEASFETTWNSISDQSPFEFGTSDLDLRFDDDRVEFFSTGVVAGFEDEGASLLFGGAISETELIAVYLTLSDDELRTGFIDIGIGGRESAYVLYRDTDTMDDFALAGYVQGRLLFDEFGAADGDTVAGHFSATIYGGAE